MPTGKETYQGSLSRGLISHRDSQADMVIHVIGLSGARTSLDAAIDTAISGLLVHPDDATLPLRTATARWFRGADVADSAEAFVYLYYDKRGSGIADDTDFDTLADIDLHYETVMWWGDDISEPATAGTPATITLQSDPRSRNPEVKMPLPRYFNVPITDILVPVSLSSSPINSTKGAAGKINDDTLTLTGTALAAHTVRYNGLRQRVTRIDNGTSVTYDFDVSYSFSIRWDGWYYSKLVEDAGEYKADKALMYEPYTFPTFPT